MVEYGISESGFERKKLDAILDDLNAEMKAIFGDNFNVSPESPDGQINGVFAESQANLWELLQVAYNAFNPNAATGVQLSNLVQLNGITRLPATSSASQLTLTGTPNTIIPAGSLVSTSDTGDQFSTRTTVTLDSLGSALVFADSVEVGAIEASIGTLTVIDTPITGWSTVTNTLPTTLGSLEETDSDLRARRKRSIANSAQNIVDAIFAAVADIDGVTQTVVLENDTDATDSNGLPPHSFQVIAVGGDDTDIANAIWLNKPAGIPAFGDTDVIINDSQGLPHTISFSRPTTIPIYVEVNLTTDSNYPNDGDELIKQAIVDYANGDLVEGFDFGLSDDVVLTRLYTPVNTIPGHEIDSIYIDTSPSPTTSNNITIGATEVALFTVDNITVNS